MRAKDIEKTLKQMYDTSDVKNNYNYWFNKLLNICLQILEYENLPKTIPAREVNANLILTNHAVFIPKKANLYVLPTNLYEFDEYMSPTKALYANIKLGSGSVDLGRNAEIVYLNSLKDNIFGIHTDSSLYTFIAKYSSLLADTESTYDIYCCNARTTFLPVAKSDSVGASLRKFFGMLKLGKREIISDDYILDNVKSIDIGRNTASDNAMSWLQARDKILEQFFRDIGVQFSNQKKENLTEEEVNVNNQLLLISWDDILKTVREGIENVNTMFGLNIKVKINDKFIVKGVEKNDNTGNNSESIDGTNEESNN